MYISDHLLVAIKKINDHNDFTPLTISALLYAYNVLSVIYRSILKKKNKVGLFGWCSV